ncbi:MAG: Ku protein [Acidimicrobiales bacterium]|jgi:DNA end-binding protein Ku
MAKAIWTGSLSFGLVNVPVGLYSATEDRSIHFNQFRAGTSERIRNKRVGENSGEEVAYGDIVKGYDLGGGEYVILTAEELASVAPGPSRTIEVTDFVDLADIDPIYFDKAYFLAPHGKNGDRAYELLRQVMAETNKVAIANFVMREKQYLVAVRPEQSSLVLETLLFADEVRDPAKEIDVLPVQASFEERELAMAKLLIDSMTTAWEPERYHDTYRERVEELIDQKRQGTLVLSEGPRPEPAPVVDLLAALQASVSAARARTGTVDSLAGEERRGDQGQRPSHKSTSSEPGSAKKVGANKPATHKTAKVGATRQAGGLSRSELLRQAGDLAIAGRSKMSREELEQAVADASGSRRRKAS